MRLDQRDAQRRPGPRPRQHAAPAPQPGREDARSTKAGASTPATQGAMAPLEMLMAHAQRRPGPRPRQHTFSKTGSPLLNRAQRRPGPRPRQHAWYSARLRPRTVAQRRPGPRPRQHNRISPFLAKMHGAQRRPGPRPRQHVEGLGRRYGVHERSTKAGASTPATHGRDPQDGRGGDRSTKAGASTPATRVSTLHPRGHVRTAQRRPGPRPRQHGKRP